MENHAGVTLEPVFGSSYSSGRDLASEQLQQALSDEGLRIVVADLIAAASSTSTATSALGKRHWLTGL